MIHVKPKKRVRFDPELVKYRTADCESRTMVCASILKVFEKTSSVISHEPVVQIWQTKLNSKFWAYANFSVNPACKVAGNT